MLESYGIAEINTAVEQARQNISDSKKHIRLVIPTINTKELKETWGRSRSTIRGQADTGPTIDERIEIQLDHLKEVRTSLLKAGLDEERVEGILSHPAINQTLSEAAEFNKDLPALTDVRLSVSYHKKRTGLDINVDIVQQAASIENADKLDRALDRCLESAKLFGEIYASFPRHKRAAVAQAFSQAVRPFAKYLVDNVLGEAYRNNIALDKPALYSKVSTMFDLPEYGAQEVQTACSFALNVLGGRPEDMLRDSKSALADSVFHQQNAFNRTRFVEKPAGILSSAEQDLLQPETPVQPARSIPRYMTSTSSMRSRLAGVKEFTKEGIEQSRTLYLLGKPNLTSREVNEVFLNLGKGAGLGNMSEIDLSKVNKAQIITRVQKLQEENAIGRYEFNRYAETFAKTLEEDLGIVRSTQESITPVIKSLANRFIRSENLNRSVLERGGSTNLLTYQQDLHYKNIISKYSYFRCDDFVSDAFRIRAEDYKRSFETLSQSIDFMREKMPQLNREQAYISFSKIRTSEFVGEINSAEAFERSLEAYTDCLTCYYELFPEAKEEAIEFIDNEGIWEDFQEIMLAREDAFEGEQIAGKEDKWERPRDILSIGVSFTPWLSTAQSLGELITGKDPVTGKEESRVVALAGVVGSVIPIPGAGKAAKASVKCVGKVVKSLVGKSRKAAGSKGVKKLRVAKRAVVQGAVKSKSGKTAAKLPKIKASVAKPRPKVKAVVRQQTKVQGRQKLNNNSKSISKNSVSKANKAYPTKYHEVSSKEVTRLRDGFDKVKRAFLKEYAETPEAIRRFSASEIKELRRGWVPEGWVIHHKKPLFRGGGNNYSNFRLMKKGFHRKYNKPLHFYEEGKNIYGYN